MALVHDLAEAQGASQHQYNRQPGNMLVSKWETSHLERESQGKKSNVLKQCVLAPFRIVSRHVEGLNGLKEAMHNFVHEMLHGSPAALRMEALWKVSRFTVPFSAHNI